MNWEFPSKASEAGRHNRFETIITSLTQP